MGQWKSVRSPAPEEEAVAMCDEIPTDPISQIPAPLAGKYRKLGVKLSSGRREEQEEMCFYNFVFIITIF